MNLEDRIAGENVLHLRQGIELLRTLEDELFSRCPGEPFRGGVGSQFRHCIDFYECFFSGLATGRIDYALRERDPLLERDRSEAVERAEGLVGRLLAIDPAQAGRSVETRSEHPRPRSGWARSTVERELQFLASHTVHHYALIVALLKLMGFELGPDFGDFGVARSTLVDWERRSVAARGSSD